MRVLQPVSRPHDGFTLTELAIALVVIGLIIGAIFVGRDLIRAAELRSVLRDVEKFKSAVNTFRLKYNCLAGDCANATDFFPARPDGCPGGVSTIGTCNGDDNGQIDGPNVGYEFLWLWQHLALAGLVAGNYTGQVVGTIPAVPGVNVPAAHISGVGYTLSYSVYVGNDNIGYIPADYPRSIWSNRIAVGAQTATTSTIGPFVSPKEAYALDMKIDDGNALIGVLTVNPGAGCAYIGTLGFADPGTVYNYTSDAILCPLVFDTR